MPQLEAFSDGANTVTGARRLCKGEEVLGRQQQPVPAVQSSGPSAAEGARPTRPNRGVLLVEHQWRQCCRTSCQRCCAGENTGSQRGQVLAGRTAPARVSGQRGARSALCPPSDRAAGRGLRLLRRGALLAAAASTISRGQGLITSSLPPPSWPPLPCQVQPSSLHSWQQSPCQ